MKKRRLRLLSRSRFFVVSLLLLQIGVIIALLLGSSLYFSYASIAFQFISIIVCIHIYNKTGKPAYKLTWIFLILLFPVFGGSFYLLFYIQSNPRKYRKLIKKYRALCSPFFSLGKDSLPGLENERCYALSRYLQKHVHYPVYSNTQTEYFSSGQLYHKKLLTELKKAKRYIFLESFIIKDGIMFNSIFDILKEKAAAGLDVRVFYDDLGCFATLPPDFNKTLEKTGIRCLVFNPFKPVLSSLQNNRDHRKIISIDGITAFTGGVNIGDEYINAYEKYGYWNDAAIMLHGEGAWSLTMIFLRLWNMEQNLRGYGAHDNFNVFNPWRSGECTVQSDGFVQPYAESPITKEYVCENVYVHILNAAQKYVYINTPYLIPCESLFSALILAAKSGTDVRIITPHIPDKPFVHLVTRSFYRLLIKAGVRIYEYSEGFNHSKTFVADDIMASVGTANLDFRSLCLHYECGVFIYKNSQVLKVKEDFLETVNVSKEITLKDCAANAAHRFVQDLLRIFAPLM
ncbi:MAG: cardiolipin synthase [Spirochaetaceae bacterium]|jgi:cardiolipin synthase|nr:cardiolipin synthase [Spirochaetaceae bacterium]GMO21607.1 MAG: cardiolipin synthase [Termitinemataceae bacterium]